ncbi:MAG: hypothetical protein ACRD9R_04620 [Pyrinomonadaceae bacterium]
MKLTGRRGPNTYGVVFASDNGPGNFTEHERTLAFNSEARRQFNIANGLPFGPPGNARFLFLYSGIRPSKKHNINGRFVYCDGHFDLDFGGGRRYPRVSPAALLDPNAPLDPGPGGLLEFRGSYIFLPTDSLSTSLDYTKQRLRRHATDRVAFDVNLFSWRTTYQFSRFLFARARIDYESVPRRARPVPLGLDPEPRHRRLRRLQRRCHRR